MLINGYHSRDYIGSEYEMGDFLCGLVRMMKPEVVVETGCYFGDTSIKIAAALLTNGKGQLITCDTDQNKVDYVKRILPNDFVNVVCCRGVELGSIKSADLVFSDSGDEDHLLDRMDEYELCKPGAIWVVHDTDHPELEDLVLWLGGMVFPYSRGFGIVRKER